MSDSHQLSRRTVAKGVAWSVPAVVAATAVPAMAASVVACPGTVVAEVGQWFNTFKAALPDLTGVRLAVSFNESAAANGRAAGNVGISFRNTGTKQLNATTTPLTMQIGIRNVDTSPAVNNTLQTFAGPINASPLNLPWCADGEHSTAERCTTPVYVDSTERKRSFSMTSSNLRFFNSQTQEFLGASSSDVNAGPFADAPYAYGWRTEINDVFDPGQRKKVFALVPGAGLVGGEGRIYAAWGIRIDGFAPLPWEVVVQNAKVTHPELATDEDAERCYFQAWASRVDQWVANREGYQGMEVYVDGWAAGYNGDDPLGGSTFVEPGRWVWSHEVGNFMAAGAEYNDSKIQGFQAGFGHHWGPTEVKSTSLTQAITEIRNRDGIF